MKCRITGLVLLLVLILPVTIYAQRVNSTRLYQQGAEQAKAGNLDEAIKTFREVIRISPWYSMGHYGLGKALLYREDGAEEAVRELTRAVSLDRSYAPAHFYLGLAYMLYRKYDKAIPCFQEAYRLDRSLLIALYNIAVMYDIMEDNFHSRYYFKRYQDAVNERDNMFIF